MTDSHRLELLDRLFNLLPALYRDADAERGDPLRDLLRVISEQVEAVEDDIRALQDNWFIETCADWVVPYLGELVGYRPAREAGSAAGRATESARALARHFAPRRDVANTIRNRRRKGTLAVLEEIARDAAGWPARVDDAAASGEVRVRLWRLQAFPVTRTPAGRVEKQLGFYAFSALGNDAPLFTRIEPEPRREHLADALNVPGEIPAADLNEPGTPHVSPRWYGQGRSFSLAAPNWPDEGAPQPIPREQVHPADLSGWQRPPAGIVLVDPHLGRICFPDGQEPEDGVVVSYHCGFSMPIGGGEYARTVHEPPGVARFPAHDGESLAAAFAQWREEGKPDAVIELTASNVYDCGVDLDLTDAGYLQVRAAPGRRPILQHRATAGKVEVFRIRRGGAGMRLVLDGLLFAGAAVHISGPKPEAAGPVDACPFEVVLRHCTLVPGLSLEEDCTPINASSPSLLLRRIEGRVLLDQCICGTIEVDHDEDRADPTRLEIRDSILDSADAQYPALNRAEDGAEPAHVRVRMARCTVFGRLLAHTIERADDCIFTDAVEVVRRQAGCLRYSYVPLPDSRTPGRYRCQPDLAAAAARVGPQFSSRRYGQPAYARLADTCAEEIRLGAEDRGEMGAFHDLFEPQRSANLQARLADFLPAGSPDVHPILFP